MSSSNDTVNGTAFDLNAFDGFQQSQDEGYEVDIIHPKTLDPIGLKITVAGPDSERQRKARRKIINDRLSKRNAKVTAELLEGENLKVIALSTISWEFAPGVTIDGKVPPCTATTAQSIYERFPFIYDQVNAPAGDRANFIKS